MGLGKLTCLADIWFADFLSLDFLWSQSSSKLISVAGHNMEEEQAREGDIATQAAAPESNESWVVEAQQKIPGAREEVWAFFTDHAGWPKWTGVAKVTLDPPGETNPNGVGTRALSCASFSNLQQDAYV